MHQRVNKLLMETTHDDCRDLVVVVVVILVHLEQVSDICEGY